MVVVPPEGVKVWERAATRPGAGFPIRDIVTRRTIKSRRLRRLPPAGLDPRMPRPGRHLPENVRERIPGNATPRLPGQGVAPAYGVLGLPLPADGGMTGGDKGGGLHRCMGHPHNAIPATKTAIDTA